MRRFVGGLLAALSATALQGQATLAGSVLTEPDERPIANAEIVVQGVARTARSDSAGVFRIPQIPAGPHSVLVRLAGYEAWIGSITFEDGKTIEVDFMLKPIATKLPTVEVKAPETRYALRLRDFEERRKGGQGRYLTADVFEKNQNRRVADVLLGSIPGIRARGNTDVKVIHSSRDAKQSCAVQVILNEVMVFNGQPGQEQFDVNSLTTQDVIGVEYYSTAATPARYMGTGAPSPNGNAQGPACGTLVIWTK